MRYMASLLLNVASWLVGPTAQLCCHPACLKDGGSVKAARMNATFASQLETSVKLDVGPCLNMTGHFNR